MNSNLAAIKTSQTAMHYGLTELKIFLAVAEEGNLSRGANLTKKYLSGEAGGSAVRPADLMTDN